MQKPNFQGKIKPIFKTKLFLFWKKIQKANKFVDVNELVLMDDPMVMIMDETELRCG